MTVYLLDTDTCIDIIRRKSEQALRRLRQKRVSEVGISTITLSELEYGAAKSSRPVQNRFALTEFLVALEVFPYDEVAARQYGDVRSHLERKGAVIGSLDMLIAAHAVALKCILVTNNVAEFKRVPGLKLENWMI